MFDIELFRIVLPFSDGNWRIVDIRDIAGKRVDGFRESISIRLALHDSACRIPFVVWVQGRISKNAMSNLESPVT